jgi:peptidoglycan/xylan/chitin deacetylase (PgdA/CDA1 family)
VIGLLIKNQSQKLKNLFVFDDDCQELRKSEVGKNYLSVRQRKKVGVLTIAVAGAASALVVGLLLSLNRVSFQGIPLLKSLQMQLKDSYQAASGVDGAIAQPQEGLNLVVSELEEQSKAELLNFSVPKEFQGKTETQVKLPKKDKVIALTFDDGPWPRSTLQILEILKKNNIKATFFMVGEPLEEYPQIGQKVVEDGHAIGNHTWHHWYRKMNLATVTHEIEDTAALIYKLTGVKTAMFRPPGGVLNNGLVDYAKKHNYFVALWSSDSTDYRRPSVPALIHNVLKDVHPGGMVLMHDGGGDRSRTVQALPKIIAELKKRGYKFVTIPELLQMETKEIPSQQAVTPSTSAPASVKLSTPHTKKL